MTTTFAVRPERACDAPAVRALLEQAFGGATEADLMEGLRADGDLILGLVATAPDGSLLGYAGFPRLTVAARDDDHPAAGLAPLAVAPAHQRRGIGHALVTAGLAALAARGETLVFVLGEPGYYRRFGFDAAAAAAYGSPYAGPHFMVRRLAEGAPAGGTLRYPGIFSRLG